MKRTLAGLLAALAIPLAFPSAAGAASADPAGDNGPGFHPSGDLVSSGGDYVGDWLSLSARVTTPQDPRSAEWRDRDIGISWGLDVQGADGLADLYVAYYHDGTKLLAEVRTVADDSPACEGYPEFDGINYIAHVARTCLGSPAALGVATYMGYEDGAGVTSEDLAPDNDGWMGITWQPGSPGGNGHPPTVGNGPPAAGAGSGYWMLGSDGTVYPFGEATTYPRRPYVEPIPDPQGYVPPRPADREAMPVGVIAVDIEPTTTNAGYWVLLSNGEVRGYGDAQEHSAAYVVPPGERAASLSGLPSGDGYWIFTDKGQVLTFGGQFYGDLTALTLNGPVLDSIVTPSGKGYYMVASDGGIFAFGDARFAGSMGGKPLNAPVQSLVPDPDGAGYWLVASDGGVFAFNADFRGSMGDKVLNRPVTGMVPFGNGYLMVGEDGGIFNFSDRAFYGSLGSNPPARPIASVAVLDEG